MPLIQAQSTHAQPHSHPHPHPLPPPGPTTPPAQPRARSPMIGRTYAKSMPVTPVQPQSPLAETPSYELYERHSDAAAFHFGDEDDDDDDEHDQEDTSSLAMITPPPPYDTPHLIASPPLPPPRRFRFGNRELFSMSPAGGGATPTASAGQRGSSAITPTKLSAAAAAMFAAPQMATQLNRKWAHLQRKRRRRNSSSGDSKELDKLVLQSVDWDENEMY